MKSDRPLSPEEIVRRRDEVLRHMLNRPPQPHKPKQKTRPSGKGRVHKAKARS